MQTGGWGGAAQINSPPAHKQTGVTVLHFEGLDFTSNVKLHTASDGFVIQRSILLSVAVFVIVLLT